MMMAQSIRREENSYPHTRFVERLDGFAEETARKTISFKKYCVERALENGCKPAEDALKRDGALVSNDSIARYLKVGSAKQIESNIKRNDVRVLAFPLASHHQAWSKKYASLSS